MFELLYTSCSLASVTSLTVFSWVAVVAGVSTCARCVGMYVCVCTKFLPKCLNHVNVEIL